VTTKSGTSLAACVPVTPTGYTGLEKIIVNEDASVAMVKLTARAGITSGVVGWPDWPTDGVEAF
jgi:hypothetical protein